jgi:CRISPR/Cas system-associated endonuclease Cas1
VWFLASPGQEPHLPAKHADLRSAQFAASPEQALAIAGQMVAGKVRNSRILLRRNIRKDTEPLSTSSATWRTQPRRPFP